MLNKLLKRKYITTILHGCNIFSNNWSITGCGLCCPVYGKLHIKDPLLLIGKSSLCGDGEFCRKKCHNDDMLDVQWPMIRKSICSRSVIK